MSDRIPKLNSINVNIIPTAIGVDTIYQNDILKNRSIISVIFDGLDHTSVTLVGHSSRGTGGVINTVDHTNDYWSAIVYAYYFSTIGEIKINVRFKGSSQSFYNLRVTEILYS